MQHNRVKPMVEGGILSAIAVLFAFISAYFPVLGVLVNLIWPVPIILLGVRHGYKWSILAIAASGVIIAAIISPLTAVGIVAGMGLIGIALGYAMGRGFSPVKILGLGTVASLLSKMLVVAISAAALGINPFTTQIDIMTKGFEQGIEMYRSLGVSEDNLKNMAEQMNTITGLIKVIIPAGFLMASVLDTYLNFMVARLVLRKLGQHTQGFPLFKYWTLPKYILYIFFAALLLTMIGRVPEYEMVGTVGTNLLIITSFALLIQGLALFSYFADKYSLSRLLRWLILFLIITNGFVSQIVIYAGAFDFIFDYRKLKARPIDE